ncbi:MAG: dehydrogenase, partial [Candidatus Omnitrophica bacterium]|nr:dehydrogenase [Candidatus Omnitrophota bacterium]
NKIGPELDGIGGRGMDRLLEDVLDPNRIVDPAYRTTIVELDSGETYIGLLKGEEGEVLLVADSLGEIHRLPKEEIIEQRVSQLSPMPFNLASDLPEEDFGNLMGFLLDQRPRN